MSDFPTAIGPYNGPDPFADGDAYSSPVLIQRPRMLDMFVPDCAITEEHKDSMTITEHPVEIGAAVSDHAFKNPAEVTLQYSWSNSSVNNSDASEFYDTDVYAALVALQSSAQLFNLVTGKRTYNNMLISELSVSVDETSEYSLRTTIVCKQLIVVSTSATTLADASNMANPASTAPTLNRGPQKLQPVTNPPAKVTLV